MYIIKSYRVFDPDIKTKCFADAAFVNLAYIPILPLRRIKQFVSVDLGSPLTSTTLHNYFKEGKGEQLSFLAFRGILSTQSVITQIEIYPGS